MFVLNTCLLRSALWPIQCESVFCVLLNAARAIPWRDREARLYCLLPSVVRAICWRALGTFCVFRGSFYTPPDPLLLGTNPFLNRGGIDAAASSLRTSGRVAGGITRPLILLPVDGGFAAGTLLPIASNSFP